MSRKQRGQSGVQVLLLMAMASLSQVSVAATLNFHAWGGSAQINSYIQWVGDQVEAQHGITLNHVKLAATSDAVTRVLAENTAGNHTDGSVDLIWINGENFAAMSKNNLLLKNWVGQLPNFALTNPHANTAMTIDFGLDTQGQEAPWGKAALVFYYNERYLAQPPQTLDELLTFAQRNPGRFTYPLPNDFLGVTFLKYALLSLNEHDTSALYQPVTASAFASATKPLWAYLDKLHPLMWREGRYMVRRASQLQKLVADSEVLIGFSFTSSEIPSAVSRYDLPETIRTYAMKDGSLGNVHFIGISYNTAHPEEAKTLVNFMLSPLAQAQKQKVEIWGDETVLDLSTLTPEQQKTFVPAQVHPSALPAGAYHSILPEPHASWTDALKKAWYERYGERF